MLNLMLNLLTNVFVDNLVIKHKTNYPSINCMTFIDSCDCLPQNLNILEVKFMLLDLYYHISYL